MIFCAFAFGVWLGSRRAEKVGISAASVMDMTVWSMIAALVGSRLAYVLLHLGEFRGRWIDTVSPFQSDGTIGIAGLVVLGGVIFTIPTVIYYTRKNNLPTMKMMDVMMPSVAFGLAIGRIGCFLNGCCYGVPTDQPWGMIFPATCLAGSTFPHTQIHPTQLYEIFYNSSIAVLLLLRTPHKRFDGELFYIYLVIYGVIRFLLEPLRFYRDSMVLIHGDSFNFTFSMLISLFMVITGAIFLLRGYKAARLASAEG